MITASKPKLDLRTEKNLPRIKRVLTLYDGGIPMAEIAQVEHIGLRRAYRWYHLGRELREKGWI